MEVEPIGLEPIEDGREYWRVIIDGAQVEYLSRKYHENGRIGEEDWEKILSTTARIISNCPRPDATTGRVTGLALGKVQSGKTLSYTTLTAFAIDNGYRVTIILAGTKNALLNQAYARLERDLDLQAQTVVPFLNPGIQDLEVLRSVIQVNGHAIIVVLKHVQRLENLIDLINSPELRDCSTIIIDDEGDEASLNTQFRSGRQSSTYRRILDLRDCLNNHAYIAYTATPQANLLIAGIDALSPDFAVLIEPGEGYCGGSTFFGTNIDLYVRNIPIHDGDDSVAGVITDSLQASIASFIIGSTIRTLQDPDVREHSMLVHTSRLTVDHSAMHTAIQTLIGLWKETLQHPEHDPSYRDLIVMFESAYEDFADSMDQLPEWSEVVARLMHELNLTEVWMVNSLRRGRDPISISFRLKNNILIGGNMLGRGVTIGGLAVTHITRLANQNTNADTLEQRARWFGYKEDYLDFCRLFLTRSLRDRYVELLRHEDDFWEALGRISEQGIPVREWPRMFALDVDTWHLRPTRSNVANFRRFRGIGWDVQRIPIINQDIASRNVEAIQSFFSNLTGEDQTFGNVTHTLFRAIPPTIVIKDLLAEIDLNTSDWEKSYIEEYLSRLHFGGRLPGMDVLLMSCGEFRNRSVMRNGRINPMQGRSPSREFYDPLYYPGDEGIHGDHVQLQLHLIYLAHPDYADRIETSAMALYIPDTPIYNLAIVTR